MVRPLTLFLETFLNFGNQTIGFESAAFSARPKSEFSIMHPLDNLIWTALGTRQATFAEGNGNARRFPPSVTTLGALSTYTPESYEALPHLQSAREATALLL